MMMSIVGLRVRAALSVQRGGAAVVPTAIVSVMPSMTLGTVAPSPSPSPKRGPSSSRRAFSLSSSSSSPSSSTGLPTAANPSSGKYEDKLLFTPGPLTTSYATKAAMLHDLGSRDSKFINVIKFVRSGLLDVAGVSDKDYTAIPIQGSGTYAVESVLTSVVPKSGGKLLVIANGAYGTRIEKIAKVTGIAHITLNYLEDQSPKLADIEAALRSDAGISHVAVIHSETTSGVVNDVEMIGQLVHKYNKSFFVDAMSSFGAVPVDLYKGHIDYLVSSANKCIEGVPGFSFALANKKALASSAGNARSLALDVHDQVKGLDNNGQFRFTPPTHAMLAFQQALLELKQEGGMPARAARYKRNAEITIESMTKLGFEPYLKASNRGYIISSFRYPQHKNWNFETFYAKLSDRGFLLYPGKVTNADCFRIGHIGRLFESDTRNMLAAVVDVCKEMKLDLIKS